MAGKHYFLLRARPPRPNFTTTMSDAERLVMQQHIAYWAQAFAAGSVVIFGPVADPAEPWGVAIIELVRASDLEALVANDPAVTAGVLEHTVLPMHAGCVRGA